MPNITRTSFLLAICLVGLLAAAPAALAEGPSCQRNVDGLTFESSRALIESPYFEAAGLRCGTPTPAERVALYGPSPATEGAGSDCSASQTNPDPSYDPGDTYEIQVVVHIIMDDACSAGDVSDQQVVDQIEILNEDFLALTGTNGENGTDLAIQFALATEDPDGMPTTGITRSCNTTWFNDNGQYYNTLAWDPNRYLNIYSNTADGALGYVPFLPADSGGALVGGNSDRVVLLWSTLGRTPPIGPPFHLGRTGTHEVGHYLGLEHTFNGFSCSAASAPGCYSQGDLICDTLPESNSHDTGPCDDDMLCGDPDPVDNYMNYSADNCMMQFTPEQTRRIRCTLPNYRPDLYTVVNGGLIFTDGFESGDTTSWSSTVP